MKDAKITEQRWCNELPPLLRIRGKIISKNEGRNLSIAAEEIEFNKWQRDKLRKTKKEYSIIDWEAQHLAISQMPPNLQRFALQ